MPFTLIRGSFHVKGYSPDGDSIRFQPDNSGLVHDLDGFRPKFNARQHVQLRLEAIDTLETHFSPGSGGGSLHQPLDLAHGAMETLFDYLGIKDVQWDSNKLTVIDADDNKPGYIISRTVEKNGRPVAFVFAGEATQDDGAEVFLNAEWLRQSYNHLALAQGWAYPTYYKGLFFDLREELSRAVAEARVSNLNIHQLDKTNSGFSASSLSSITIENAILPKLFRRLSEYMVNFGSAVGFKKKLAQSREPVLHIPTGNFTHFDTFIEQAEDSIDIKLTCLAEELVFDEMPTRPANSFSAIMGSEFTAPPKFVETVTLPEEAVRDVAL